MDIERDIILLNLAILLRFRCSPNHSTVLQTSLEGRREEYLASQPASQRLTEEYLGLPLWHIKRETVTT